MGRKNSFSRSLSTELANVLPLFYNIVIDLTFYSFTRKVPPIGRQFVAE